MVSQWSVLLLHSFLQLIKITYGGVLKESKSIVFSLNHPFLAGIFVGFPYFINPPIYWGTPMTMEPPISPATWQRFFSTHPVG